MHLVESFWAYHLHWAIWPVLLAAFIRGYTGFGFAAIAISGLNLIWPPQTSVPIILLLDLIGTLKLLTAAWPGADKGIITRLSSGALIGIPLGLTLLIQVPEQPLKLMISLTVLAMALLLMRHPLTRTEKPYQTRFTGIISGAFTAAASIGGLPVVCYLLTQSISPARQRSTLIIFLALTDLVVLLLLALNGLLTSALLLPTLLLCLPTWCGVSLGQAVFNRWHPRSFRPIALPLLGLLASLGLIQSLQHLI
ncbi:hypothetical protein BFW38_05330 [Terasakiispira papahanaumokuakeensis]|uniref:Probable membrane transporter protein n=1 Tax=Terasakiispira papahanaumokuakeensis TaxID=197479 RepID=A0A1E2V7V7_9GAMM|nr:sulfite exporter TauE/SafE family protein [Terasakiispira papahanaumokuakeensis]ODC03054.1 hypothetical protein BFW38_05330 [Terasakiispira papahanaumokuakeensis]